jgi:YHS domain-containing protein
MTMIDPVCKMELDEKEAKFKAEYQGKTYFFCNLSDKKKFEANPKKYLES